MVGSMWRPCARGADDETLRAALLRAGWTRRQARRLLAGLNPAARGLSLAARVLVAVGAVLLLCLVAGGGWYVHARRLAPSPRVHWFAPPYVSAQALPRPGPRPPDPALVRRWQEMANRSAGTGPKELTVTLQLTGPTEVWVGDSFTMKAQGSYDLPPGVARSLLNGSASLVEDYTWTSSGGFEAPGEVNRDTEQTVVIPYSAFARSSTPLESMTTVVNYHVTVSDLGNAQPHFFTQEAQAQATSSHRVRALRVHLIQPTDQIALVTEAGKQETFQAQITADPGAQPLPDAQVAWIFGDGATGHGSPLAHTYRRRDSFYAVCAVDYQGHHLEVWLPVHVGNQAGTRPAAATIKNHPGPTKPYQLPAPGN